MNGSTAIFFGRLRPLVADRQLAEGKPPVVSKVFAKRP